MQLYVGTSGYSYKEWKGTFYPEKLPAKQMLRFYGEQFRTVEINNTFYKMPEPEVVETWAKEVPADFRFVIKAPQVITHIKRLKVPGIVVEQLIEAATALKKRLGPLLFQLPPNFKKDVPRLREFLALLPARRTVTFEFRHPSWFDEEVFDLLQSRQVAMCIAEADSDLEVPFVATADWGYLRLRRPEYSDDELKAWLEKVREQDWKEAFVFFKHEDTGTAPRFAKRLLELAG